MQVEVYFSADDFTILMTSKLLSQHVLTSETCKQILFKMDRYGNGEEMLFEKVFDSADRAPSFRGFTEELFIGMKTC